ncbi:MAG: aldo/keto reductase, partial [Kribbellaceae bacterium]|nr:aldo/keto reductase [Kribbellaceae bacterium]
MRYRLFGSAGLRVSEFALGTMTFGERMDWGIDARAARPILDAYAEAGGTFIDTANRYAEGAAERIVGDFLRADRDRFVVGTKYTLQLRPGDLNSEGIHRKNMMRSIEASLRSLGTDYVDVLWVHTREPWTPVAEVMRGLDDLVRSGKVLYVGVSDWPAWEIAEANTMAELRGWTSFAGLQSRYNLLERTPERELIPMADSFGMSLVAWGPLAEGRLTGKYLADGHGRLRTGVAAEIFQHSHAGPDDVVHLLTELATRSGHTSAQLALAWLRSRGALPLVGATNANQLRENLTAVDLDPTQLEALTRATTPTLGFPHNI